MLWERADAIAAPTGDHFDFAGGPIFLPVFFAAMGADNVDAIARLGAVRVLRRTP